MIFRRRRPRTIGFLNLPEDVMYCVLHLCDTSSMICISRTTKYLHYLAFSPTVWIPLVADLRHRGFVDPFSARDIRSMPTQSLVAVVKRLVVGPNARSPSPSPSRARSFSGILHKLWKSQKRRAPHALQAPGLAHVVLHTPIYPEIHLRHDLRRRHCTPRRCHFAPPRAPHPHLLRFLLRRCCAPPPPPLCSSAATAAPPSCSTLHAPPSPFPRRTPRSSRAPSPRRCSSTAVHTAFPAL
ncbi:hypothetical protein C8R44DRAFT_984433, partial [Mycena epipterygia]